MAVFFNSELTLIAHHLFPDALGSPGRGLQWKSLVQCDKMCSCSFSSTFKRHHSSAGFSDKDVCWLTPPPHTHTYTSISCAAALWTRITVFGCRGRALSNKKGKVQRCLRARGSNNRSSLNLRRLLCICCWVHLLATQLDGCLAGNLSAIDSINWGFLWILVHSALDKRNQNNKVKPSWRFVHAWPQSRCHLTFCLFSRTNTPCFSCKTWFLRPCLVAVLLPLWLCLVVVYVQPWSTAWALCQSILCLSTSRTQAAVSLSRILVCKVLEVMVFPYPSCIFFFFFLTFLLADK